MPDSPLVSILIPLYNAELYIEETIRYALGQDYQNIELIIVDDGSTDSSYTKAAQFLNDPRVKLLRNPGKGACAARNEAYRHSKGNYVMFLDADDYCTHGKIAAQVRVLENAPEDAVAFCTLRQLLKENVLSSQISRYIDHDYEHPAEMLIDMWGKREFNCPHCYLVPREVADKAGGWDETVLKNQDGEYFSRVITSSSRLIFVPNEYAIWRRTYSGVSSMNTLKTQQSEIYALSKISSIILSYDASRKTRKICATALGSFMYHTYPECKMLFPEIDRLLKSWQHPLVYPSRGRLFSLLRHVIGWKFAFIIVNNTYTLKFCSFLSSLYRSGKVND